MCLWFSRGKDGFSWGGLSTSLSSLNLRLDGISPGILLRSSLNTSSGSARSSSSSSSPVAPCCDSALDAYVPPQPRCAPSLTRTLQRDQCESARIRMAHRASTAAWAEQVRPRVSLPVLVQAHPALGGQITVCARLRLEGRTTRVCPASGLPADCTELPAHPTVSAAHDELPHRASDQNQWQTQLPPREGLPMTLPPRR